MIVPDPIQIRDILAGVQDDVVLGRELKVGSVHALQERVGARASGWVQVIDRWCHRDGGFVHRVRVCARPKDRKPPQRRRKPVRQDAPRLLGKSGGYTSNPAYALQLDREAELEAVPKDWQDRFSGPASKRDALLRLERVAAARTERWRRRRERQRVARPQAEVTELFPQNGNGANGERAA